MPSRVSSPASPQVEATEVEAPTQGAPAQPVCAPAQDQGNTVEAYRDQGPTPSAAGGAGGGNAAELQAQLTQERRAKKSQLNEAMRDLWPALVGLTEASASARPAAALGVAARAAESKTFLAAASSMPREEVRAAVEETLRNAEPGLSKAQLANLTALVMNELGQTLRTNATQRMRELVVSKMDAAAGNFRRTAEDPAQLKQLIGNLAKLERPGATAAEHARAAQLRGALGLKPDQAATVDTLATALKARAGLMEREASEWRGKGENTIYRSLLTHDVGRLYEEQAGIQPGSWASEQVAAVKEQGETDERRIAGVKFATSIALGAATAGMGLGAAFAVGMTAAYNSPEVMAAVHGIDSADAGAAAGTAAPDAGVVARRNATVKTGEAVLATVTAGLMASDEPHVGKELAEHILEHAAVEATLQSGAKALEGERRPATGKDALERAR